MFYAIAETARRTEGFAYRRMADRFRSDTSQTHIQLIQRVATLQDRHAFMLLFAHFGPRVKSFMMRSGAGEMQAEDLAQDTLLTVWRKAQSFDPHRASASTWIFTIARNLRIDALRRERLAANAQQQLLGPDAVIDGDAQPDQVLDSLQRAERLRAALKGLTADQIELVRLSFFDGMPHQQIATTLNIPLGTVKSRLRRSMLLLREILEDLK